MNTANRELRLTGITRYKDVETGTLQLTIGTHVKRMEAIWLANLRFGSDGRLPLGELPLYYRNYRQWLNCPRVSLNHQTFMWIVPLDCDNWVDMGCNLYLCSPDGWPAPLPTREFRLLADMLQQSMLTTIVIEGPQKVMRRYRLNKEEQAGNNNFWDF